MLVRVQAVTPLEGFRVRLVFTDGSERVVDLEPYLRGPIFAPLAAGPDLFRQVTVDPRLGTIVWPNGADFDPATLHDWPVHEQAFREQARRWQAVKS